MADEARVIGAVGLQHALILLAQGGRRRAPRLGLGHVGARHQARRELRPGLVEGPLQQRLAVAVELDHRLVAHHVEIGADDAEQDGALDRDQMRALGLDRVLGLGRLGDGLAALIERLGQRDAGAARIGQAMRRERRGRRRRLEPLAARGGVELHRRAPARQRLVHAFVGGAQIGALGLELRIVVVGVGERGLERFGARGRRGEHPRRREKDERGHAAHAAPRRRSSVRERSPADTACRHRTPGGATAWRRRGS